MDINRQLQPFLLYGPNVAAKNKDVFVNMTSSDAAITSLFVDAGGDRVLGSEYIGISVGKLIQSHAAYLLTNSRTLLLGNDTVDKTYTLLGDKKNSINFRVRFTGHRPFLVPICWKDIR